MEDFYVISWWVKGQPYIRFISLFPPLYFDWRDDTGSMLSAPLRDRFGIISHMEYYDEQDLQEIVLRSSDIFQTEIIEEGHWKLLAVTRNRLESLIACSNGFVILPKSKETGKSIVLIADQALSLLQVDQAGLDYVDQKLLRTMIESYMAADCRV